ncbi:flippase-like domain-containing protein [Chlorobium phaeovibrioides]|uniref:Flippase-like domain-containing protein n=1 Tax=Chlorobium phaeovibrioides TaxID=1094 RepID=A0ABW9UPX4_CHLPH|nr:lysylphosphatidylglycerol synthase transmembrane domain-containing protein [Chlorobium phaeovibrioides]MWV54537.1 flippase-like domain-containing protein [Chlorobium phaeovibrioides]
MEKKGKSVTQWTGYAGLAAGILLILYLFQSIDLGRSLFRISTIGFSSLFIMLPFFGLHFFETIAWTLVFPPGSRPISFFRLFKIQVISETVSMTLPAGMALGEPLRPFLCNRLMGISYPVSVAAVTVRKLLLSSMQGVYTIIGTLAGFMMLQRVSPAVTGFQGLGFFMLATGIAVCLIFLYFLLTALKGRSAQSIHSLLMMVPGKKVKSWLIRRESSFSDTDEHLRSFQGASPAALWKATFWYLVGWAMLAVESYIILRLLGAEISFPTVLAIDTTLVMLRALFFFIPSGLGIQDIGYMAFFQASGMPEAVALGGAFILIRRFKEVLWYSAGYAVMFMSGIHLHDPQQAERVQ